MISDRLAWSLARAVKERGQLFEIAECVLSEAGTDFAKGALGRIPDERSRQRLEEPAADVERGQFIEGELQARLPIGGDPPALSAVLSNRLDQRKAERAEEEQVAADRLFRDAHLMRKLAHRLSVSARG